MIRDPVHQLAPIGAIHPELAQFLACAVQLLEEQPRTGWVRERGSGHNHHQQQAQRIDQEVALAPHDIFALVVAPLAGHLRGLDTLAVDAARRRMLMAPGTAADLGAQRVVDALPGGVVAPPAEVVVAGLPFRIVLGQHAPLGTRDDDVQDGVDDLAHVNTAGAATGFCGRDEWHDTLPLTVGQIGWVQLVVHSPSVPQLTTRPSPSY